MLRTSLTAGSVACAWIRMDRLWGAGFRRLALWADDAILVTAPLLVLAAVTLPDLLWPIRTPGPVAWKGP